MKHKRKHFGEINIGDIDKIISYMHLNCNLKLKLMYACCTINAASLPMVAQVVQ